MCLYFAGLFAGVLASRTECAGAHHAAPLAGKEQGGHPPRDLLRHTWSILGHKRKTELLQKGRMNLCGIFDRRLRDPQAPEIFHAEYLLHISSSLPKFKPFNLACSLGKMVAGHDTAVTLQRRAYLENIIAVVWALTAEVYPKGWEPRQGCFAVADPLGRLAEFLDGYQSYTTQLTDSLGLADYMPAILHNTFMHHIYSQDASLPAGYLAGVTHRTVRETRIDARFESNGNSLPVFPFGHRYMAYAVISQGGDFRKTVLFRFCDSDDPGLPARNRLHPAPPKSSDPQMEEVTLTPEIITAYRTAVEWFLPWPLEVLSEAECSLLLFTERKVALQGTLHEGSILIQNRLNAADVIRTLKIFENKLDTGAVRLPPESESGFRGAVQVIYDKVTTLYFAHRMAMDQMSPSHMQSELYLKLMQGKK